MSTRCNIRVLSKKYDKSFMLYHHHDGYPSGVGMDLKTFLDKKEYWSAYDISNKLIKGIHSEMYERLDEGYYITSSMHGDVNYLYLIDCDNKQLKCYYVPWDKNEDEVYIDENLREIKKEE